MAHFYVDCQGSRGRVHCLGGKDSGVHATLASYQGSIRVRLYEKDGVDYTCIIADTWHGEGEEREIYDGPINRPLAKKLRSRKVRS